MSNTPNLKLPFIDPNQNQKSVTHNAALSVLDALVNLQVQSNALSAPPTSPGDGQCWIVASGGTGAWTGKDLNIAAWQDGAWAFYAPNRGFMAYVDNLAGVQVWNGSAWVALVGGALSVSALAIGTSPDSGNPLSARLGSALFTALPVASSGTGDVRIVLSKETAARTASFLFQDNFSGRAEIGLAGDDDFHFKVSPDGSTFVDALRIGAATGRLTLGAPMQLAAYAVGGLPTGVAAGAMAFASNGRKIPEAAGGGTGVAVVYSNGAWRRVSDDTPVAA